MGGGGRLSTERAGEREQERRRGRIRPDRGRTYLERRRSPEGSKEKRKEGGEEGR